MAFNEQTEKLTQDLIQAEYKNACEKFGEKYNSLHEGYAFLLKEMEEVEMYIKRLKNDIDSMWSYIKSKENKTKFIKYYVDNCFDVFTNNSIKELAQVGAVLMKIKNTLEVEE